MSEHQTTNERPERRSSESGFGAMPCCPDGMAWPGPGGGTRQMMQTCPCATWFQRHRLAAYTALTVVVLGFLALSVGWVLGVIAFFRAL